MSPPADVAPSVCKGSPLAITEIRRLTRREYDNTVRDLLGVAGNHAESFPAEESLGAFPVPRAISADGVEQAAAAAERLAGAVDLSRVLPCRPEGDGSACARAFVTQFGLRTFRRPLTEEEVGAYAQIHRAVSAARDFEAGARAVIEGMLQSPHFLYRIERGAGRATNGVVPLSPYETATRLAYFLSGSAPGPQLLDAAGRGELGTEAGVVTWARKLLAAKEAREVVGAFHDYWLNLGRLAVRDKDPKLFPEWTPAVRSAVQESALRFFEEAYLVDGKLETLLTGRVGFSNQTLGPILGQGTGETLARTLLPAEERAGLLTLPAFLAYYAKDVRNLPVERGKFVREELLCQEVPAPPGDVAELPDPIAGATLRDRLDRHRTDPTCAACHALLDPIGLGFEMYDPLGRVQKTEEGRAVDARGSLTGTDVDGAFVGGPALAKKLAVSPTVRSCLVDHWMVYAIGRKLTEDEVCIRRTILDAFEKSKGDLREMLVAVASSPAFRFRRPLAQEGVSP